jgi:hypothetical protein
MERYRTARGRISTTRSFPRGTSETAFHRGRLLSKPHFPRHYGASILEPPALDLGAFGVSICAPNKCTPPPPEAKSWLRHWTCWPRLGRSSFDNISVLLIYWIWWKAAQDVLVDALLDITSNWYGWNMLIYSTDVMNIEKPENNESEQSTGQLSRETGGRITESTLHVGL